MPKPHIPTLYRWLLGLFALAGMARWLVHPPSPQQAHDLRVVWSGAGMLSEGRNPLDAQAMQQYWRQHVAFDSARLVPGSDVMPAIYPPAAYVLYLPVGLLPFSFAWALNLLLMACALVAIHYLSKKIAAHAGYEIANIWILLLLLAFKGTANALAVGQPTFLALSLSLGSFYLALEGKNRLAGLLAGIALFKFTVVLPVLVWMLRKRNLTALSWTALSSCALILPVVLVSGIDIIQVYLHNVEASRQFCFDTARPGYPLVYELSVFTEIRILAALQPALPAWLPALLVLPAFIFLLWRYRNHDLYFYGVASLASLTLLQHLYYDILMLLPLGILWLYRRPNGVAEWMIAALLLTCFMPVNRLLDFTGLENAFLYMHNAWVLAGLVFVLCWKALAAVARSAVTE